MKLAKIFAALAAVVLLAAGCSSQSRTQNAASQETQSSGSSQPAESQNSKTAGSYTMTEVQSANSPSKCWTAVNGKVYDLTPFVNKHPGGVANIIKLCGTDGTAAFAKQHGGQPKPEQELASLQIGILKQ